MMKTNGLKEEKVITKEQDQQHSIFVHSARVENQQLLWFMNEVPQRSLESLVLDEELKSQIVKDIKEFGDDAGFYKRRGIPYRTGYLFHGPPGVGKTSMAKALATHFRREIYSIPFSESGLTDTGLAILLGNVSPRSLILLDDIDVAGLNRDITKSEGPGVRSRVTLSGLLNAIDGVSSPEGHVLIATTNRISNLDEALLRPGRLGKKVEFRRPTREQKEEIFYRFYESDGQTLKGDIRQLSHNFGQQLEGLELSQATVVDFLIGYKTDPAEAVREATKLGRRSDPSEKEVGKSESQGREHPQ
ncbi:hypothetical protein CLAIMM_01460 [Cladophialophora immunda]|nr:hypothetical protein CLAIMM_01460 [Cladophialophora immunda]